jgi:catechol 2,3-dioxygenase
MTRRGRSHPDLLSPGTAMSAVTLHVDDLDAQTRYYREAVGLAVLPAPEEARTAGRDVVALGRAGTPIVVLVRTPGLPRPRRGEAGLFHTAILFDDEPTLAAAVASVASTAPGTYVGSADHLVSQAFYFTDPEGNGVELYADRPRDAWRWARGLVQMDSLPLDPNAFLDAHLEHGWTLEAGRPDLDPDAGGAVVGHVHLQVGDVPTARAFYVDTLGFEVTGAWHGALFVAAGGYHHHMAVNTWRSMGAGPRAVTLGLGEVSITVPTSDDVDALASRLRERRVPARHDGAELRVEDPWRNLLRVRAA